MGEMLTDGFAALGALLERNVKVAVEVARE
jgi:hypothetical protein